MTASTRGEDTYIEPGMVRGKCADTGLVSGHAYTLISTVRTSTGVKLVKLRYCAVAYNLLFFSDQAIVLSKLFIFVGKR